MSESDLYLLVELLENTMDRRGKDGPGGYSSATFSPKSVLLSLRCLLTHTSNQLAVATHMGVETNRLLMKALAMFAASAEDCRLDAESAEYAVFGLYLQSNYGFENLQFLPAVYSRLENDGEGIVGDLSARVLTCYLSQSKNLRPAGQHAAEQLLLRLKYLNFADAHPENVSCWKQSSSSSVFCTCTITHKIYFLNSLPRRTGVPKYLRSSKASRSIAVYVVRSHRKTSFIAPFSAAANQGTDQKAKRLGTTLRLSPSFRVLYKPFNNFHTAVPKFDTWIPLTTSTLLTTLQQVRMASGPNLTTFSGRGKTRLARFNEICNDSLR